MFYKVKLKDHIRVPPDMFSLSREDGVRKCIKTQYDGFISKDFGIVIDSLHIDSIAEGVIIPGDGAAYYDTTFNLLCFKPELQEVIYGKIKDIADFGAFISVGPIEGMIHISQTMDDFVSFSKDKVLMGKETKRTLRVNDLCKARIIAVSYKDITNPKLGLTMRQTGLGKLEWIEEGTPKKEKEKEKEKDKKSGKGKKEASEE